MRRFCGARMCFAHSFFSFKSTWQRLRVNIEKLLTTTLVFEENRGRERLFFYIYPYCYVKEPYETKNRVERRCFFIYTPNTCKKCCNHMWIG